MPSAPLAAFAAALLFVAGLPAQFELKEFAHLPLPWAQADTYGIAVGDVDGDGRKDIVTANGTNTVLGNRNQLYLADGLGGFRLATQSTLPQLSLYTLCVELGDVDGDGDLDAFFGNGGPDSLLLNDGSGRFADVTATHLPSLDRETWSAAFVDVDGDRDLDLLCAGDRKGVLALLLNDGTGRFVENTPSTLRRACRWISLADLDQDGDLDLTISGSSAGGRARYRNDKGTWQLLGTVTPGADKECFTNADGDVWPDLAYVGGAKLFLAHGDGKGAFGGLSGIYSIDLSPYVKSTSRLRDLAVGDFDADGDDDFVLTFEDPSFHRDVPPTITVLNHGGSFLQVAAVQQSPVPTYALRQGSRVVDIDDDGDLDLLWAQGRPYDPALTGEANQLLLNTRRQITLPWPARLGNPFTFEYHASGQQPGQPVFVIPVLGHKTLRVAQPLPGLGVLHFDPAALLVLNAATIPRSGTLSLLLAIPQDPGFKGLDVLVQAVYIQGPRLKDLYLSAPAGTKIQ
jgi:hypothetical protein